MTSTIAQAVILAAGEGRRLAPITDTLPKPLVPFFGRPLIEWALQKLIAANVTRVAVNAFHHADALAAHLDALAPHLPFDELYVSREPALLGTGGAIAHLAPWLDDAPFYVINADAVFAAPLTTLTCAPSLLVTRDPAFAAERRLIAQNASPSTLTALNERSDPSGFTFCGVTLADADLPARLPQSGPSCIIRQGFMPFLDRLPVELVETTAFFADTGTPESLVDAHRRGLPWASTQTQPISRGISPG